MTVITEAMHIIVVGCGNIGAMLCVLLARLPEVGRLTLIDFDKFSPENLATQAITQEDVGQFKAKAMARQLRRIRPDLTVEAFCVPVEELPLGFLRCDVICACLDSRIARMYVNEAAWRLGVSWIDAGVKGADLLARVSVFHPAPEACCLECSFSEAHYATLEVRHPCQKGPGPTVPATNAPAYLGALAASLQAAECQSLLLGAEPARPSGWEALLDARGAQLIVSRNRRNPQCRFDHRVFAPQTVPARLRLKDALCLCGAAQAKASLAVPGRRFLRSGACPHCHREWPVHRFVTVEEIATLACPHCASAAPAPPFFLPERLSARETPSALLNRSLRSLGVRPGDLFTVACERGDARYFLLGGRPCHRRSL